jgi:hypothetical protein
MKKFLFLFASMTLLLSSCKKDADGDDNDPSAITKENLAGNYVLVSAVAKTLVGEIDITNEDDIIPACTKDDILTLKTDFTFTSTDAGVTCATNENISGTWSLNDSSIVLRGETLKIKQFDGKNLQLGYTTDAPPFGSVNVISTFRKQ